MRRLLLLVPLLLLPVTACGEDGCKPARDQMSHLSEDLLAAPTLAERIIVQAKIQELQDGDFWVCFRRDTPR
jgi:hypothetical protein